MIDFNTLNTYVCNTVGKKGKNKTKTCFFLVTATYSILLSGPQAFLLYFEKKGQYEYQVEDLEYINWKV